MKSSGEILIHGYLVSTYMGNIYHTHLHNNRIGLGCYGVLIGLSHQTKLTIVTFKDVYVNMLLMYFLLNYVVKLHVTI